MRKATAFWMVGLIGLGSGCHVATTAPDPSAEVRNPAGRSPELQPDDLAGVAWLGFLEAHPGARYSGDHADVFKEGFLVGVAWERKVEALLGPRPDRLPDRVEGFRQGAAVGRADAAAPPPRREVVSAPGSPYSRAHFPKTVLPEASAARPAPRPRDEPARVVPTLPESGGADTVLIEEVLVLPEIAVRAAPVTAAAEHGPSLVEGPVLGSAPDEPAAVRPVAAVAATQPAGPEIDIPDPVAEGPELPASEPAPTRVATALGTSRLVPERVATEAQGTTFATQWIPGAPALSEELRAAPAAVPPQVMHAAAFRTDPAPNWWRPDPLPPSSAFQPAPEFAAQAYEPPPNFTFPAQAAGPVEPAPGETPLAPALVITPPPDVRLGHAFAAPTASRPSAKPAPARTSLGPPLVRRQ